MYSCPELEKIAALLGVTINGSAPTDLQIHDKRACKALLSARSLSLGESFVNGWWDCADLAGLYTRALTQHVTIKKSLLSDPALLLGGVLANLQSRRRAFQVGEQHYDLGNDLYEATLDPRMVYTSAMWNGVDTLASAQEQKLETICQKLGLKAGDRVLDIGCGWGSFMKYAAETYGVSCVGLTVSKEQAAWGRASCADLPIEFVLTDYREYTDEQKFDHIVSIEMIEAVGPKNFRMYFEGVKCLLKPEGKFLLQAIIDWSVTPVPDPWLDKYIFRNGVLPSPAQLERATRGLFFMEHLEDIGPDYDRTLMAWWENFDAAYEELSAKHPQYDERFYRMWKYYLQSCAAMFRTRQLQDWQIVFGQCP